MLAVLIHQRDLDQESLLPEGLEKAVEELTGGKDEHHLFNWSNTHECRPKRFFQPETQEELEAIVKEAHNKGAVSHVCDSSTSDCFSLLMSTLRP